MPIIKETTKNQGSHIDRYNLYPDQFVSDKEKQSDDWIKTNMDYFANVAFAQYQENRRTFVHNYNLVKGILRLEDFYIENKELASFADRVLGSNDLPSDVKHYPILNPPINTLVGEISKRPDVARVKAMDEDSKNEQLTAQTEMLHNLIFENAMARIQAQMAGEEVDEEQLTQMVNERIQEYLTDYTSNAEKWGNHVLEALKMELNLKELSEDCFRDLIICSREFVHIYEDNSKLGIGAENLNPKNVWYLTLPDKKYIHKDAYAGGTVRLMELSEIINKFDLTKEEIDELRDGIKELSLGHTRGSSFNQTGTGQNTIKYDTYSPLIEQERLMSESLVKNHEDSLGDFLGLSAPTASYGTKYVVVEAYWQSKQRIGKLTYYDREGKPQTTLVDETYKKIPNEISIEWDYINRWYKGLRVGPHVYKTEPYKLLDYCPIIGVVHEIKNVDEARSMVDLLKPYQVLYNVCMNQLYKLLEKEVGNVYLMSIRDVPIPKDGDPQDALEIWEETARRKGVLVVDNSPENVKAGAPMQSNKSIDWTRTAEIQSRYTLAQQLKIEAWELVGITRERTGGIAATQTATGTNAALSQSYAQTEPWFTQHDYVMNETYQALLDAAQFIQTQRPETTLSYINTEGEDKFIKFNSQDIKMKDLKVFVTTRAQDQRAFEELKMLAQPMLQNGATPYEIATLYTTNSVRQMKQVFKSLRDKMDAMQQQQMQMEQQQMEQQQAQFEQQMQLQAQQQEEMLANQNEQAELERLNKKEIALIAAAAKERSAFDPVPGAGDQMMDEAFNTATEAEYKDRLFNLELQKLRQKQRESSDNLAMQMEQFRLEREKMRVQQAEARKDRALKAKTAAKKPKAAKK